MGSRLVGPSFCHNFSQRAGRFMYLHEPIGTLVLSMIQQFQTDRLLSDSPLPSEQNNTIYTKNICIASYGRKRQ